jgi:hypothetical protein
MVRCYVVLLLVSCLAAPAFAQSETVQTASPAVTSKPAVKKSAPKSKGPKPSAAVETGPCQIGVISGLGDRFLLQHIGVTVFGNEFAVASVESWGLDDVVVARVRAAAGAGTAVRRISSSKEAFEPYYNPPRALFRDASKDLTAVVQNVAANSNCERYLVVTRSRSQVPGTNQTVGGIGMLTNWTSNTFKKASLHTFFQITVFDGRTFAKHEDPLDNVGARLAASFSRLVKEEDFQQLDDFEPPTTPEAAVSNARLRDGTRAMLAARLDKILPAYLNDDGKTQ